jgi:hypothetical protein
VWWPLALIWILGLANSLESWLAWAALAGLTAPLISESPGPEARFSFLFLFLFSRQSHKPLLSPSKRPFQYICSWPRCPVRMLLIRWISFWGSENRRGPMLGHAAVHAGGSGSRATELLRTFTGRTSHAHLQPSNSGHPMAFAVSAVGEIAKPSPYPGEVYINVCPSHWPNLLHFNRWAVVPAHR